MRLIMCTDGKELGRAFAHNEQRKNVKPAMRYAKSGLSIMLQKYALRLVSRKT